MGDYTGTPPTILPGDVPDGDDWHEITAALTALTAPWTSYTPTWTASSVNPAIGNGSIVGAYRQIGKTVDYRVKITMGSTTTFGTGFWIFTLPVTATAANSTVGACDCEDVGTAARPGVVLPTSTTTLVGVAGTSNISATVPHTWANTDLLIFSITYEAA